MTIKILENSLNEACKTYKDEINLIVDDEFSKRVVTEAELFGVAKQTFYLIDEFKAQILKYLSTLSD